jgi:GTP-binding protein
MPTIHFQKAAYLGSATQLASMPKDTGHEVAFIGRSNSGKSSAINAITHQKSLARTSVTPGRTQMINFFALSDQQRLVDLPGYGFAKAPKAVQAQWEQVVTDYLVSRESLSGLILLMDARHPLKDSDQAMIEWTLDAAVPLHILLTKADKLTSSAQKNTQKQVTEYLSEYSDALSIQLFSALKGTGLDALRSKITQWLSKK